MRENEGSNLSRCVLLVGVAGAVPSNLAGALDRRGLEIAIARQPPEVMSELADGGVSSVVVVEASQQERVDELVDAVTTYYPQTRCWGYTSREHGGSIRLDPLSHVSPRSGRVANGQGVVSSPQEEAAPQAHVKSAGQRLRSLVVKAELKPSTDDGPLVTEEELAMLLGPDSVDLDTPMSGEEGGLAGG